MSSTTLNSGKNLASSSDTLFNAGAAGTKKTGFNVFSSSTTKLNKTTVTAADTTKIKGKLGSLPDDVYAKIANTGDDIIPPAAPTLGFLQATSKGFGQFASKFWAAMVGNLEVIGLIKPNTIVKAGATAAKTGTDDVAKAGATAAKVGDDGAKGVGNTVDGRGNVVYGGTGNTYNIGANGGKATGFFGRVLGNGKSIRNVVVAGGAGIGGYFLFKSRPDEYDEDGKLKEKPGVFETFAQNVRDLFNPTDIIGWAKLFGTIILIILIAYVLYRIIRSVQSK